MEIQNTSKEVILVVDDDPNSLALLFEYLNNEGFKVLPVQSSDNALLQAERHHPDIILLDILMPGMDGFEICHHLKQNAHTHDTPIIFMTALSDTLNKVRAFKAGTLFNVSESAVRYIK